MNTMRYKGYYAKVEYSEEDECFVGHIAGIRDVVGFHGESVGELRQAFEEAVEDYLETYKKLGKRPNRPYSGRFVARISPDLHARIALQAELKGQSLNQWVGEALETVADS